MHAHFVCLSICKQIHSHFSDVSGKKTEGPCGTSPSPSVNHLQQGAGNLALGLALAFGATELNHLQEMGKSSSFSVPSFALLDSARATSSRCKDSVSKRASCVLGQSSKALAKCMAPRHHMSFCLSLGSEKGKEKNEGRNLTWSSSL